jgi:hypothetical protein
MLSLTLSHTHSVNLRRQIMIRSANALTHFSHDTSVNHTAARPHKGARTRSLSRSLSLSLFLALSLARSFSFSLSRSLSLSQFTLLLSSFCLSFVFSFVRINYARVHFACRLLLFRPSMIMKLWLFPIYLEISAGRLPVSATRLPRAVLAVRASRARVVCPRALPSFCPAGLLPCLCGARFEWPQAPSSARGRRGQAEGGGAEGRTPRPRLTQWALHLASRDASAR